MPHGTIARWSLEARGALLYAAISVVWILSSDELARRMSANAVELTRLQHWKGWFFVAATSIFLYALVRRFRRRDEAMLLQTAISERQLNDIVSRAADGILLTEAHGRVLRANPAACRLLGYTEARLRGEGSELFLDPRDARMMYSAESRDRDALFQGPLQFRRSDGSTSI